MQRKTQLLGEQVKKDYPTDPTRNAVYKFVEKEVRILHHVRHLPNAVMMACEYDQPDSWTNALEIMGYIFGAIFIGEAALKLYAMNPYVYFADSGTASTSSASSSPFLAGAWVAAAQLRCCVCFVWQGSSGSFVNSRVYECFSTRC